MIEQDIEVKPNKYRAKTACPDCGKVLSLHARRYTHARSCKGKPPEPDPKPELPAAKAGEAPKQAPPVHKQEPPAAKEAPAAKSTPAPQPEPSSGTAADDPRLSALTAKSREARKDAGIDVDAEVASNEVAAEDEATSQEEPIAETPAAATTSEPAPSSEPSVELPDGYFPTDNRIADLLASVKKG